MCKCKVSWCLNETSKPIKGKYKRSYCDIHIQYKEYAANAPTRPHLMYKVEKICSNHLQCEKCGFDPLTTYPDRNLRQLSSLMDVDHINPNTKHTLEGEHPSNYQLLCKHCHILKSHDEGDYRPKKLKK
jgi:5-methylcytosine-specific restriction endonuclease McrA